MRTLTAPTMPGNALRPARVAALLVLVLIVAMPGFAGAAEPEWIPSLKLQLKSKYNCDLASITTVRELTVGDQRTLEGRIRCIDQREVDFTRGPSHQPFQLRLCDPTLC